MRADPLQSAAGPRAKMMILNQHCWLERSKSFCNSRSGHWRTGVTPALYHAPSSVLAREDRKLVPGRTAPKRRERDHMIGNFLADESGATATEYGLIAALVAVACIIALETT